MEGTNDNQEEFFDRSFEEVEDGYVDGRGFYTTPNGSFWDNDEVYFNHFGNDKHGGKYDKFGVYFPGPNWNEDFLCYEEDIDKEPKSKDVLEKMNVNVLEELKDDDVQMEGNLTEEEMKIIYEEAMKRMNNKEENKGGVSNEKLSMMENGLIQTKMQNVNNDQEMNM